MSTSDESLAEATVAEVLARTPLPVATKPGSIRIVDVVQRDADVFVCYLGRTHDGTEYLARARLLASDLSVAANWVVELKPIEATSRGSVEEAVAATGWRHYGMKVVACDRGLLAFVEHFGQMMMFKDDDDLSEAVVLVREEPTGTFTAVADSVIG